MWTAGVGNWLPKLGLGGVGLHVKTPKGDKVFDGPEPLRHAWAKGCRLVDLNDPMPGAQLRCEEPSARAVLRVGCSEPVDYSEYLTSAPLAVRVVRRVV